MRSSAQGSRVARQSITQPHAGVPTFTILRTFGVAIKTITGRHGDAFAGQHARYIRLAEAAVVLIGGV